jgi:hypothetical protein
VVLAASVIRVIIIAQMMEAASTSETSQKLLPDYILQQPKI